MYYFSCNDCGNKAIWQNPTDNYTGTKYNVVKPGNQAWYWALQPLKQVTPRIRAHTKKNKPAEMKTVSLQTSPAVHQFLIVLQMKNTNQPLQTTNKPKQCYNTSARGHKYLSHVANCILQVEFMENVKDLVSWFLSRPSHQYFAEEPPIKIGPPDNSNIMC